MYLKRELLIRAVMSIFSDQTVQFLYMLGTWVAGACTAVTAIIAVRLARRGEMVKPQNSVGLYLKFPGDGTLARPHALQRGKSLAHRRTSESAVDRNLDYRAIAKSSRGFRPPSKRLWALGRVETCRD